MVTQQLAGDPATMPAPAVAEVLGTDPDRGLAAVEAARRLDEIGPNELTAEPPVPAWRRLVAQLHDPLVRLLGVAIVVSLVAWVVEGRRGVPFDAVVIAVVVVLNAVLGFAQEEKAQHAVEALARLTAATATVLRDGVPVRVPTGDVVPGDVLVLAEGDTVPADARLLTAAMLRVSEASLTGESEPVLKDDRALTGPAALAERFDMVFGGTFVTQGSGRAVVTATGMATEVGRIADLLHQTPREPTPLQVEIAHVGRMLGIAVVVVAVVVLATVVGVHGVRTVHDVVTALLLAVSLAVAAVPEGLPTVLSVVLALGVQRMARHGAVVKDLSSVETLGSSSVVCSDKTGTLTRGEMTVTRVVTASGDVSLTGVGYRPVGDVLSDGAPLVRGSDVGSEVAAVLGGGSLANDAALVADGEDWSVHGDPTEAAIVVAEAKLGTQDVRAERFRRVDVLPFTAERRLMTTVHADVDRGGRLTVVTKGAPEVLLDRCTHLRVGTGAVPLDDDRRRRIRAAVEALTDEAFRTLGVAYRDLDTRTPPVVDERLEQGLVYAGTLGMIDPPRPEAAAAVAEAHRAGVRVLMITGDHPRTAARIAADLGIVDPGGPPAVTGAELDALDAARLRETVRRRSVYARVSPEHKLRIVDALQADGKVVAMTGDGVNDAPALRAADIGVAMGLTGTEVTKEAATMVLADDDFTTIVRAVREGRGIFDNIRKFLRYLLSSNMGEVLTVFLGVVLAGTIGLTGADGSLVLPLLAAQILWINLLTDSAPALAMGVDPETEDVMGRPPRALTDRVIDLRMWCTVLVVGLAMAVATLGTMDLFLPGGMLPGAGSVATARTAGFTVLVLAQLVNVFAARSETRSVLARTGTNRWLWAAVAASLALQVAVVHVPLLQRGFSTTALTPAQWGVCAAAAGTVLVTSELLKAVLRHRDRRRVR